MLFHAGLIQRSNSYSIPQAALSRGGQAFSGVGEMAAPPFGALGP